MAPSRVADQAGAHTSHGMATTLSPPLRCIDIGAWSLAAASLFTETTDNLESEDLTDVLNHYLTEMSSIALQYGATIDKYIGDAMMLFSAIPRLGT